ncbi:BamA/TamA family outer membrane protein [Terracidiphilus gabretensis]|uniref:BamA/TamA family outer membrane protein n=1 Tax=Terracidiphilus gabretensis TaxID=1577687 RepID=UPI00071BB851|nr:BamA/TamA family outer membrane protein [Terracidiphilus gabretensis]
MRRECVAVQIAISILLLPLVHGQQAPTSSQQSQQTTAKTPVLFGTNVNLESGSANKGTTLGDATNPEENASTDKPQRRGEWAFAPIPLINPSIGNGGGGAVMYMRHLENDMASPPSTFAVTAFGTDGGSWGAGLGAKLYLHHDRFRILAGGGGGEFNYNFFGVGSDSGESGIDIPLSQRSRGFLVEFKVRVFNHLYLGPRYHLVTNRISLNSGTLNPSDLPIPLPSDLRIQTAALGVRIQRDSSDNPFYPRKGSLVDLTADFFDPAVGAQRNYKSITTSYDKYLSAGAKNVFAIHGSVCGVSDQAPFFDVCQLGSSKDVRGYQMGQFRDDRMLVGQAEYRRELFWRLGVVAFAGAGAVGKTFTQFGDAKPGGGFGARFAIAPKNHMNLRVDFAWGDNSRATYVSLGEAF